MLRKIATGVYVICLAAWARSRSASLHDYHRARVECCWPKVLPLAGNTNEFGIHSSWSLAFWRFLGLLSVTIVAGCIGHLKRSKSVDAHRWS